jgi:hypothetical protein
MTEISAVSDILFIGIKYAVRLLRYLRSVFNGNGNRAGNSNGNSDIITESNTDSNANSHTNSDRCQ